MSTLDTSFINSICCSFWWAGFSHLDSATKTSVIPGKNGNFSKRMSSKVNSGLGICGGCFHVSFVWPASFRGENCVVYTQGSTEKLSALLKQTIRTSISSTIHAQVIETRLHDRSYSHLFSVSSLSSDWTRQWDTSVYSQLNLRNDNDICHVL